MFASVCVVRSQEWGGARGLRRRGEIEVEDVRRAVGRLVRCFHRQETETGEGRVKRPQRQQPPYGMRFLGSQPAFSQGGA